MSEGPSIFTRAGWPVTIHFSRSPFTFPASRLRNKRTSRVDTQYRRSSFAARIEDQAGATGTSCDGPLAKRDRWAITLRAHPCVAASAHPSAKRVRGWLRCSSSPSRQLGPRRCVFVSQSHPCARRMEGESVGPNQNQNASPRVRNRIDSTTPRWELTPTQILHILLPPRRCTSQRRARSRGRA